MKVYSTINIVLLLTAAATGCQLQLQDRGSEQVTAEMAAPDNRFMADGQHISHPDVYSVQLFRSGSENSPPIIRLDSNQQLTVRFDMIEAGVRQFRISITHHHPDWSRSPLQPEEYMEGFSQAFFGTGTPGMNQRPAYRQYEYQFPNKELAITESGNFMIHVEDFETREPIFVLPFFIHENKGRITSSVETVTTPRANLRSRHVPSSTFVYPDFIDIPQFDLEYYFTQNQFWGRTREADVHDTSVPDEVFYEVSREHAFTGDYEFRFLNLTDIARPGATIRDFKPDQIPPTLILREDGLAQSLQSLPGSRFGRPDPDPEARYGNVHFRFQPEQAIEEDQEIYLTGDFVNWMILGKLELSFNPETGYWETSTFLKEGSYAYKYVMMENNQIFDLDLDDTFRRVRQEFSTFVYYRDPARHYYRLLQTNTFYSN